jgi:hypothetical protein
MGCAGCGCVVESGKRVVVCEAADCCCKTVPAAPDDARVVDQATPPAGPSASSG